MKRPRLLSITVIATAGMLAAGSGLVAGCGSAGALRNAKSSFEKAKAAGAETKAPFEYYAAEAYLDLAQHEADEGDNKQSRAYSAESEKYSAQAIGKAGGGAR